MAVDQKEYLREYWDKNRLRLLAERKAKREASQESLDKHRARQRTYQRRYRVRTPYKSVVPLPRYWIPRAVRRAGMNSPFKSKYGIYGLTEISYPPSSWSMVEDAMGIWGIRE